ncbi:MAG: FGGY family carbohydrate kinase [Chloroflexota bacterium]|nr:FGGY family carbohydrate kinase [Chloroflexota bacterium]
MTSTCLLGIDVGGTAVKVGLFQATGEFLALKQVAIPVQSPRPGWAEIDPERWLEAVTQGVHSVLDEAGVSADCVAAIGLSNMIGTVTPLDASGSPLRPAITYFDNRSAREASWILRKAPDIEEITGNRIVSGNTSLTSILWLRAHERGIYEATTLFAQVGTLLFRWLTGETRVDWTNASFMGLYDYRTKGWDPEVADALGVDLNLLAPVAAPDTAFPLLRRRAEALGLRSGTPVVLGGIDGAMASVGVGAIHPGDVFDVSGTSEMVAACLPEPSICPQLLGRWHVVPGIWVLIGAMSTSGAALQWFGRELWGDAGTEPDQALYQEMTAAASASPPGANGVVFLPHMMGERAPLWDPHARGIFFGLSLSTERGDMVRAIMEGTAFAMRHLLELIEGQSGVSLTRVVTVGGAARNALWRQIKADVWGVEVVTLKVREATALGAAITAGVGAGVYENYDEAIQRALPAIDEVISPDASRHRAYEKPYQVYRTLYPALANSMYFAATGERH